MDLTSAELSTLAALAGSAIGGITPLISNQLIQRSVTKRKLLSRELSERRSLYAEFIRFAATVYVQATTTNLKKLDDLILLYALVGRIRLLGSPPVIHAAETFVTVVTRRFGENNLTVEDLRVASLAPHIDPLNEFSLRCREELRNLFRQGFNE